PAQLAEVVDRVRCMTSTTTDAEDEQSAAAAAQGRQTGRHAVNRVQINRARDCCGGVEIPLHMLAVHRCSAYGIAQRSEAWRSSMVTVVATVAALVQLAETAAASNPRRQIRPPRGAGAACGDRRARSQPGRRGRQLAELPALDRRADQTPSGRSRAGTGR